MFESLRNSLSDSNSSLLSNAAKAAADSAVGYAEDQNLIPSGLIGRQVPAQVQANVAPAVPNRSDGGKSGPGDQTQADAGMSGGAISDWIAAHKKALIIAGVVILALAVTGVGAKLLRAKA